MDNASLAESAPAEPSERSSGWSDRQYDLLCGALIAASVVYVLWAKRRFVN